MKDRLQFKPDVERLPDAVTARVLTRASELDALRRAGATVAELRAAATEAGISAEAFDAALAELREAEATEVSAVAAKSRPRAKLVVVAALVVALAAGLTFAVGRTVAPTRIQIFEQRFALRCLTPAQVSELVRPVVDPLTASLTFSDRSPGEFTIRAAPAEIARVRAVLERAEASCQR